MHKSLLDWFARMNDSPRARIALMNLVYDKDEGRTPLTLLKRFVRFIAREWPSRTGSEPDELIRMFAMTDPDRSFCQGTPSPSRPRKAGCSRIIDAKTLWANNIDLPAAGFVLKSEVPTKEIRKVETRGLRGLAIGEMRSRAPFAWVTRTDKLDRLRKRFRTDEALALNVRDRLGLTSYMQREKLVEVQYSPMAIATMEIAPPTFIEGSPGDAFRSVKKKDRWGRTRHLKTGKESLPEAVHRPLPFTDGFKVLYVGRPKPVSVTFDCDPCPVERFQEFLMMLDEDESE